MRRYPDPETQTGGAAAWAVLALVMFACLGGGIIIGSWLPYLTR